MITLTGISLSQVETAIREGDGIDYADFGGYTGDSFEQELYPLMDAISGLCPAGAYLSLALIWNDDTTTSGGHVIVHLANDLNLASPFIDLRHLVDDRHAVGMAALLDMAENILGAGERALTLYQSATADAH